MKVKVTKKQLRIIETLKKYRHQKGYKKLMAIELGSGPASMNATLKRFWEIGIIKKENGEYDLLEKEYELKETATPNNTRQKKEGKNQRGWDKSLAVESNEHPFYKVQSPKTLEPLRYDGKRLTRIPLPTYG